MTTQWFKPTITTQTAEFEEHVQWQAGYIASVDAYGRTQTTPNTNLTNGTGLIQSIRPLVYIANDGHAPRREKTWYITFTGFNITDITDPINGIEVQTQLRRRGRIMDDTISLSLQGNMIGENKIDYGLDELNHVPIHNSMTYGGLTDLWQTQLTAAILQDPTFGVTLRLQSHLFYPHRESVLIDSVQLRVY
jgi:hypothetical protein